MLAPRVVSELSAQPTLCVSDHVLVELVVEILDGGRAHSWSISVSHFSHFCDYNVQIKLD